MTLVIAQKTDNGILSVADTKLTYSDGRSENPYWGLLKSHIIGRAISAYFAGNIDWIEEALERLINENGSIDTPGQARGTSCHGPKRPSSPLLSQRRGKNHSPTGKPVELCPSGY